MTRPRTTPYGSLFQTRLKAALDRYGRHDHDCNYVALRRALRAADSNAAVDVPCSCGWEATARALGVKP